MRLRPSGRTTTKSASSRIASCRDTPGWPMSTTSTTSLTERSPPRSASTMRRRVGSARTWNTSGMPTYYCRDIYRVNNISSGANRRELPQVGEQLGDLLAQLLRFVAAQVDDLFRDALGEELARQVEQLIARIPVPAELDGVADVFRVTADGATCLVEHRSPLPDLFRISAGDVPHVGVAGDQPEHGRAGAADPERRMRPL